MQGVVLRFSASAPRTFRRGLQRVSFFLWFVVVSFRVPQHDSQAAPFCMWFLNISVAYKVPRELGSSAKAPSRVLGSAADMSKSGDPLAYPDLQYLIDGNGAVRFLACDNLRATLDNIARVPLNLS